MPESPPFAELGRFLIITGIVLALVGVVFVFLDRTGVLGRLPGDIVIRRKHWTLWVPIASSILLSLILTLILNLLRRR
jgi:hypothetical protein